jgi:hypothetical protein
MNSCLVLPSSLKEADSSLFSLCSLVAAHTAREKHGWLGDSLDASDEAMYNFNTMAVHENFLGLISENQGSGGDIPVVIPVSRPFPSWNRSTLTEIYLCHSCSCQKY